MKKNIRRKVDFSGGFIPLLLVFALAFFPIDVEAGLMSHGLGDGSVLVSSTNDASTGHGHHSNSSSSADVDASSQSHHHGGLTPSDGSSDEATACCNVGGGMCVAIASNYIQVERQLMHDIIPIVEPARLNKYVVETLPHPPKA